MSRFYPDKDESAPETAYKFLVDRRVRRTGNKKSAESRMALNAADRIEALLKEKRR